MMPLAGSFGKSPSIKVTPLSLGSGVGEKKEDQELAQGTWVVVSIEADGKPFFPDQIEELENGN